MNVEAVIAEHELLDNIHGSKALRGSVSLFSGNNLIGRVGFKSFFVGRDIELGPEEDKLQIEIPYRGRGFGSLLVEEAVAYLKEIIKKDHSVAEIVYAAIAKDNLPAKKILEKNGFRIANGTKRGLSYERTLF